MLCYVVRRSHPSDLTGHTVYQSDQMFLLVLDIQSQNEA